MYAVCRRLTSCRQATNALMWINYLDRQSASFNKKSYCSPRAKGVFRLDSACGFVAFTFRGYRMWQKTTLVATPANRQV